MKQIAQFFKVLADETRLQMLWLLFNHQELCVCDLMAALGTTQSKASRHLATLRHAGLVADRKVGAWSYYSIRQVQNDFERIQLASLRELLAGHPDAQRVLQTLQVWLNGKERNAMCAVGGAADTATSCAPERYTCGSPIGEDP